MGITIIGGAGFVGTRLIQELNNFQILDKQGQKYLLNLFMLLLNLLSDRGKNFI